MKVGLYSPYLSTMGGGERYFFSVADFFLKRGDQVDIFVPEEISVDKIRERLAIDLSSAKFRNGRLFKQGFSFSRLNLTAGYDLFFYLSDGSLPLSLSKKNIVHFQVPFNFDGKSLANKIKLSKIDLVVCNSRYTKNYVDKTFGINSSVLYPPVNIEEFTPGQKENIILSVGRFFAPSHPKKQEIMIREFVELYKNGLKGWKLVLLGGISGESGPSVAALRKKTAGYPIRIVTDASFSELKKYYSVAKIYWHAAGYGEDLTLHPERAEHFGISTVEAMAAGCVPVVFGGGGQLEIVRDGENGKIWRTAEEFREQTTELINKPQYLSELSRAAFSDSRQFSARHFDQELEKYLSVL